METVIEGKVLYKGNFIECCLGIDEGRIVSIKKILKGDKRITYSGKVILPGAVDVHVHFRDPGLTHKEDFQSGSISAAFGGVTCVFDMPNTIPPVISIDAAKEKLNIISKKAWVDFGIFGGCSSDADPQQISDLVVGFKLYMSSVSGPLLVKDEQEIGDILRAVIKTNKPLCIHAEDENLIVHGQASDLVDHECSRPIDAEVKAIKKIVSLYSGKGVHICHISSSKDLEALEGTKYSTEVTPHHLLLDNQCGHGAFAKVNPPLRTKAERTRLFSAFVNGRFDVLASDHAPHTIEEKNEDFSEAPCGMPSVETSIPLMLALVKRDLVDIKVLMRSACEAPSEIFGIRKGRIDIGFDADLMVVDFKKIDKIKAEMLHSKCGWTVYEGREAIFPYAVILRGMPIIEENSIIGERMGVNVAEPKHKSKR